jgi:hypothetical protein
MDEQIQLIIGKHDAIPRTSYHETKDGVYQADDPETAYKGWLANCSAELMELFTSALKAREEEIHQSYRSDISELIRRRTADPITLQREANGPIRDVSQTPQETSK